MKDIIECVKTGEVTYAVRDTSINGITIKVDDIMGIDDDGIKKVGQDVEKVTLELLEEMVDEDSELDQYLLWRRHNQRTGRSIT